MGEGGNILFQNWAFQKAQLIYVSEGFFFPTFIYGHLGLLIRSEVTQWVSIIVACRHFRLFVYAWTPLGEKKALLCLMHYYD